MRTVKVTFLSPTVLIFRSRMANDVDQMQHTAGEEKMWITDRRPRKWPQQYRADGYAIHARCLLPAGAAGRQFFNVVLCACWLCSFVHGCKKQTEYYLVRAHVHFFLVCIKILRT